MSKVTIPGNKFSVFGKIYSDTTVEALEARLLLVKRNQNPTLRSNPVYVSEVRRLSRAIDARKEI